MGLSGLWTEGRNEVGREFRFSGKFREGRSGVVYVQNSKFINRLRKILDTSFCQWNKEKRGNMKENRIVSILGIQP